MRDAAAAIYKITKDIDGHIRRRRVIRMVGNTFRNAVEDQLCIAGMCAICRIEFILHSQLPQKNASHPKVVPCGHVFHRQCLQLWFQSRTTCPLCRASAGVPESSDFKASSGVL